MANCWLFSCRDPQGTRAEPKRCGGTKGGARGEGGSQGPPPNGKGPPTTHNLLLTAVRVGKTQSNMSQPSATHTTRSVA